MKRLVVGVVFAVVVVSGCAKESATPPQPAASNPEFAAFVNEYFDWSSRTSPSSATYNGIHDYDAELDDFSRDAVEARITDLHGFLDRAEAFDRAKLAFDVAVIEPGSAEHGCHEVASVVPAFQSPVVRAGELGVGLIEKVADAQEVARRLIASHACGHGTLLLLVVCSETMDG